MGALIAKGYEVQFKMSDGSLVKPPKSYAMLHDPSGIYWPSCSVLVASFERDGAEIEDSPAKEYFGYDPVGGTIRPPSKNLKNWRFVGDVAEIDYTRTRPGSLPSENKGEYFHPFGEGSWLFPGGKLPSLYKLGRLVRLEFKDGCRLSWKGFEWP